MNVKSLWLVWMGGHGRGYDFLLSITKQLLVVFLHALVMTCNYEQA